MTYFMVGLTCMMIGGVIGVGIMTLCMAAHNLSEWEEKELFSKRTPVIEDVWYGAGSCDVDYYCPVCDQEYVQSKEDLSRYCPNCGIGFDWGNTRIRDVQGGESNE